MLRGHRQTIGSSSKVKLIANLGVALVRWAIEATAISCRGLGRMNDELPRGLLKLWLESLARSVAHDVHGNALWPDDWLSQNEFDHLARSLESALLLSSMRRHCGGVHPPRIRVSPCATYHQEVDIMTLMVSRAVMATVIISLIIRGEAATAI